MSMHPFWREMIAALKELYPRSLTMEYPSFAVISWAHGDGLLTDYEFSTLWQFIADEE